MRYLGFSRRKLACVAVCVLLVAVMPINFPRAQVVSDGPRKVSFRLIETFDDPRPATTDAGPVIGGLHFSLDGRGKKIYLWDDANGKFVQQLAGDGKSDLSELVEISVDNRIVVANDNDRYVRIWEVETGRLVRVVPVRNDEMRLRPDGKAVAVGNFGNEQVTLLDVVSGKTIFVTSDADNKENQAASPTFCFSPDGKILAVGQVDRIDLWNAETGERLRQIRVPKKFVYSLAYAVKFSPNGKLVASNINGEANLLETETGKSRFPSAQENIQANVMAFSRDGKIVASGSNNGKVRLWNVESGRPLGTFKHSRGISRIEFSHAALGLMLVRENSSKDDNSTIWDVVTGNLIEKGHPWKFSKDGKRLLKSIPEGKLGLFEILVE